jgi:hypothetical protein
MLNEAANLSKKADLCENDKNFLVENYSVRENEPYIKHAMVLSFYFLLRY